MQFREALGSTGLPFLDSKKLSSTIKPEKAAWNIKSKPMAYSRLTRVQVQTLEQIRIAAGRQPVNKTRRPERAEKHAMQLWGSRPSKSLSLHYAEQSFLCATPLSSPGQKRRNLAATIKYIYKYVTHNARNALRKNIPTGTKGLFLKPSSGIALIVLALRFSRRAPSTAARNVTAAAIPLSSSVRGSKEKSTPATGEGRKEQTAAMPLQ